MEMLVLVFFLMCFAKQTIISNQYFRAFFVYQESNLQALIDSIQVISW